MTKLRLSEIKEVVASQVVDVADLCALLEIGIEEILDRFPDRLREHQYKFDMTTASDGVYDNEDEGGVIDEWEGFQIIDPSSGSTLPDED